MDIKDKIKVVFLCVISLLVVFYIGYRFGFKDRYILTKEILNKEYNRGCGDGGYRVMNQMVSDLAKQGIFINLKKQKEEK